jgi:NTP pyrophosphatase (non-canonical NTP hydrolase)
MISKAIQLVELERLRQDRKWGVQNHTPEKWVAILGEEYGELCQAVVETVFDNGSDKGGYDNIREEAVHVAAVAVALIECLDRLDRKPWHLKLGYLR